MDIDPQCKKWLAKVGARIREMRYEQGLSLEQMEERGWASWQNLQKIEMGKNMTLASLWKVAKALQVEPEDILKDL